MPICGPTQGKLVDINNPLHHPTTTSLQQHPCCLPQQPHGGWQWVEMVEREWGEWVEREREIWKVTTTRRVGCTPCHLISFPLCCLTMRCATHTLCHLSFPQCCLMMWRATHALCRLFLFLSVAWWHGMQPTCHIVYFFSSVLFDDVACNPHAMSSISSFNVAWRHSVQPTCSVIYFFLQCCLMTQRATHMPCCLFLSLHLVYFFLSILFDDVACNPHAVLSIYFYFYSYILLDFIRSVLEYNL